MDTQCGFETTQWTGVLMASDRKAAGSVEALQKLCGAYWYPIYAFARRQGVPEGEAKDLTQAFFAHILEKGLSIRSGADRGRFRSFLIRCYRNFVTSQWRKSKAAKRGGGVEFLSIHEFETKDQYLAEVEHQYTPEQLYERKWAQTLLQRVHARLAKDYSLAGKEDRFRSIQSCLMTDCNEAIYAEIAEQLGMKPGAVRTAVHRMRTNFGRLLREEVLRLVDDASDVEEELHYVLTLLT